MAISPVVQNYQKNILQQTEEVAPEQITFNTKFGDLAYNILRSKFAKLLPFVVTFKVIDSDIEDRNGVGVFIIAQGEDVLYLPVVLAEGAVVSCEMVYDKTNDLILPLVSKVVTSIVDDNRMKDHTLRKSVATEDTRRLFRNMFRPPTSSSPVLAGSTALDILPNPAREAVSSYLQDNPAVLAKIAEFFPVESLAESLAPAVEVEKEAAARPSPAVLDIETLAKGVPVDLSDTDRKDLLARGYVIKTAGDAQEAVKAKEVDPLFASSLELREFSPDAKRTGTAHIFRSEFTGLDSEPCLLLGPRVVTRKGCLPCGAAPVLGGSETGLTRERAEEFGAVTPEELSPVHPGEPCVEVAVLTPAKSGGVVFSGIERIYPSAYKKGIDGDIYFCNTNAYGAFGFVRHLSHGRVVVSAKETIYPKDSLLLPLLRDDRTFISSAEVVLKLIKAGSPRLRLKKEAGTFALRDSHRRTEHKFQSPAQVAEFAVCEYGLSKQATDMLLDTGDVYVFTKEAFAGAGMAQPGMAQPGMAQPGMAQPGTAQLGMAQPGMAQPGMAQPGMAQPGMAQPGMAQPGGAPEVDPQVLDAFVEQADPELLDTGILASLAGDQDIKILLVDMIPTFTQTVTAMGKAILLFSVNKRDIEEQYGREEYSRVLNSQRRVFKVLGELIFDLKGYINMR